MKGCWAGGARGRISLLRTLWTKEESGNDISRMERDSVGAVTAIGGVHYKLGAIVKKLKDIEDNAGIRGASEWVGALYGEGVRSWGG